ncbi:kappaPI-actitoxin-Avd3b-like [Penaeus japonicus]|uniref:kappaPI-actitoxin-Avd3b-like n=1 Tax=Penaeus japonicus TaxID=27405 RepID=UPI001C7107CE|nr:kappaPI-actitoxin-Avd3b-like [Penaeus japonicus]
MRKAVLVIFLAVALAVGEARDDACNLPLKIGQCRAALKRFYYNQETQQCDRFLYGGCRGNSNNFKTLEECQQKCM